MAAVGAIAVLGVGALAVRAVLDDGGGGASSPEAAVERLAEAIEREDPVGATAALAPEEVADLDDLLAGLADRAADNGFGVDGDPLAGIDLTVEDLELDVDEVGDGVARVSFTDGRLGYRVDTDAIGDTGMALLGEDAGSGSVTVDDLTDDDVDEPFLMTVRRGGGWYVSLTYTAAEYAVAYGGLARADFDSEGRPLRDPAEEPEDAVVELVEALGSGDVRDAAAVLPEDEWQVLLPYREALDEALQGEDGDSADLDLRVDDVDVTVDDDDLPGGGRAVRIDGASGTGRDSFGDEVRWDLEGWCLTIEGGFEEELEGGQPDCLFDPATYLGAALQPGPAPSVVVVEERGGWVVSPARTFVQIGRDLLPRLDLDILVTLLDRPELVPDQGEVPFGEEVSADLGTAGVATWTLTAVRDIELVVQTESDADISLVPAGGDQDDIAFGTDGYLVEEGQPYTVVVRRDRREGDAPVAFSLGAVTTVDAGEVGLAGTFDAALTPAEPVRRTTFTVGEEARAEVTVTGAAIADISEDGETTCSSEGTCSFVPGATYEVSVHPEGPGLLPEGGIETSVGFEVRAIPPPGPAGEATVDGRTTVRGELDFEDDRRSYDLFVPDGAAVVVTVAADDPDADIDVEIDGEAYQAIGDEEIFLDGPIDEPIEVYLYTSEPTGFTITVAS